MRILVKRPLDDKAFRERRRITLDDVCGDGISHPALARASNVPDYVTTTNAIEAL